MPVKSFQGARKSQRAYKNDSPIRVRDYMTTRLITFRPEQSVEEVIHGLIKNRISLYIKSYCHGKSSFLYKHHIFHGESYFFI